MGKPRGVAAAIFMRLFGTYNHFAMSRFFKSFIKDTAAFKTSAQKILETDFEHIAVGHGNLLHGGPKEVLEALQERGFKV